MDLRLRQLQMFVAVADTGTFTDAAVAVGVSQASVSRSVAALETALGVRLLQRTTRHVALTAAGARMLPAARRVLDEVAHLQRAITEPAGELRIGYNWAALGKHTRRLQKTWATAHPSVPLVFVQSGTVTAGLSEGIADVAVVRRSLDDDSRFATALVGVERRFAAVATDNVLARRRQVRMAELRRYPVAIDTRTGTTTPELWHPGPPPETIRHTRGVDEWLTLIAAGQAVGVTSEATAHQNPRPGVAYRAVRDAPPIPVRLAWWVDTPPAVLPELLTLIRETYGQRPAPARHEARETYAAPGRLHD